MTNGRDIRVVIGAGDYAHNNLGWLHTQEDDLNLLQRDDWLRQFAPGSLTAILAEHVWEHLTEDEGTRAARICHEFLKPGGYVRCVVPDGYFPNASYQRMAQVDSSPDIPNHPAASHKIVYNYRTLRYDQRKQKGQLEFGSTRSNRAGKQQVNVMRKQHHNLTA